jgi:hypothetical protein
MPFSGSNQGTAVRRWFFHRRAQAFLRTGLSQRHLPGMSALRPTNQAADAARLRQQVVERAAPAGWGPCELECRAAHVRRGYAILLLSLLCPCRVCATSVQARIVSWPRIVKQINCGEFRAALIRGAVQLRVN